jgi:serine/threonine protein phosphatase 1
MPSPMKTFVFGDVHGALTKLERLLESCRAVAQDQPAKLIFLGDYIDRGPHSKEVVETLIELTAQAPDSILCLLGNHEALALAALEGDRAETAWQVHGGMATLRSYGVTSARALPRSHLDWFRSLPRKYDDGLRFFVHAGIDPDRPLDEQDPEALLWIREPFLSDTRDYGRLVVHGHTPILTGGPDLRPNRLNIDTGAAYGGPLTVAVFDEDQAAPIEFVQAFE